MNIKSQTPTIRSYGTPSIFSGVNLWFIKNGFWYFKNYDPENPDRNKGPEATGDFTPDYSAKLFPGSNDFQKNLNLLNERINTIHKELSYWDLYKITQTVFTPQSFPAIISGLPVGNSAVINCDTFTYNNKKYHRGDVIVKISDSDEVFIPAVNTGVYVPTGFDGPNQQDGGYTITYEYKENVEQQEITVPGLIIASSGNSIYGQTYTMTNIGSQRFAEATYNGAIIKPVIKTFVLSNLNEYEEIVLDQDFTVGYSNHEWIITLLDKPKTIYVQVK